MIKREIVNFPDFLQKYIMDNFMPNYKKYIKFLKKEHKGKLDSTDNKLENYFGNTLNKNIKKYSELSKDYSTPLLKEKMVGSKTTN